MTPSPGAIHFCVCWCGSLLVAWECCGVAIVIARIHLVIVVPDCVAWLGVSWTHKGIFWVTAVCLLPWSLPACFCSCLRSQWIQIPERLEFVIFFSFLFLRSNYLPAFFFLSFFLLNYCWQDGLIERRRDIDKDLPFSDSLSERPHCWS